jgi:phosphoglycolate phosphatase-like HAD superfamily hydrolase
MQGNNQGMATISVNGRIYHDIQLVAFDKDGTLIDFQYLWAGRVEKWINWLTGQGPDGNDNLYLALCHSLGFDPARKRIINDSPLAVASMSKINTIVAAVLYQNGQEWLAAEQTAAVSAEIWINDPLQEREIQPIGDVGGKIGQLAAAGIRIAVITSDDRSVTEATLPILGIAGQVDLLVCGDDDVPNKPAPDGLLLIGRQLNIQPSQMLMVGDTASDMKFGRNAGAAGCIGIRGGAGNQNALNYEADEVIDSIDEIKVINHK